MKKCQAVLVFVFLLSCFSGCVEARGTSEPAENGEARGVPSSARTKGIVQDRKISIKSPLDGSLRKASYRVLSYPAVDPNQKFPLVFAFHFTGADEKTYLELLREEAQGRKIMIVALPTPTREWKEEEFLQTFDGIAGEVRQNLPVDSEQIFLIGTSSGAFAARSVLVRRPSLVKAAVLVAGPGSTDWVEKVGEAGLPPVLFVHGGKDNLFGVQKVIEQAEALKRKGIKTKLRIYPEAGHDHPPEWNREIFDWIEKRAYS